jgi:hypothetical protein
VFVASTIACLRRGQIAREPKNIPEVHFLQLTGTVGEGVKTNVTRVLLPDTEGRWTTHTWPVQRTMQDIWRYSTLGVTLPDRSWPPKSYESSKTHQVLGKAMGVLY